MSPVDLVGTALCFFLAWLSFAFTLSAVAGTPRPLISITLTTPTTPPTPTTPSRPDRLALASRQRAYHRTRLAHLHHISHTLSTNAFPLTALPPELQLLILAHLSPYPHTFLALTRVSHSIHALTLRACIPRMSIALITTTQLTSFSLFLASPRALHPPAGLVHRLWVCPLRRFKEDKELAVSILRRCTNVRTLACEARTLRSALYSGSTSSAKPQRLRHTHCTHFTLLLGRPGWDIALTPTGPAPALTPTDPATTPTRPAITFLQRLTHLRVPTAQCIPRTLSLSLPPSPSFRLTHISYRDPDRHSASAWEREWEREAEGGGGWLRERFPALGVVVVTSSRPPEGVYKNEIENEKQDEEPRMEGRQEREQEQEQGKGKGTGKGLVVHHVYIPREYTEMHLWREGAAPDGAKSGFWGPRR